MGTSAALYLVNNLFLKAGTQGLLHTFFLAYFNDILAGIFVLAFANFMLSLSGRGGLDSPGSMFLFLLPCSLVWELLAPHLKSTAVFDWFDFLAYFAGGMIYYFVSAVCRKKRPA